MLGGEIQFQIDDSKVVILTRAARLRPLAISYIAALRDAAQTKTDESDDAPNLSIDIAQLNDVLAWLIDMET